jgi:peptide-methionine (S)-S-oxide reductase
MLGKYTWWTAAVTALVGVSTLVATGVLARLLTPDEGNQVVRAAPPPGPVPAGAQTATFGGGCFWCTEAFFQRLRGVHAVVPGYSGGSVKNPTYRQVCSGTTGHAEVIQVIYDPAVISYVELLEVFWKTHDPTTANRQGNDSGPQYRSVIFYHAPDQKALAEQYKQRLDASGAFDAPIVTEITAFTEFYPAEAYHQNFYLDNPRHGYCAAVIRPKMEKFEKVFKDKLKPTP